MRVLLVLVALTGCTGYRAGSFSHPGKPFAGERRTVGCLDVAVEQVTDPRAVGPVTGFTIGNRCDRAVSVDLLAVTVVAMYVGGAAASLEVYDPSGEIRPAVLDGRATAREVIEYQLPDSAEPLAICVDLSRLDAGAPVTAPEVCFGSRPMIADRSSER